MSDGRKQYGFWMAISKKENKKKETIKKVITPITQFFESTPSCSSKDYRATSPSEESNETEAGTTVSTQPSATQNTSISEESENVVNEDPDDDDKPPGHVSHTEAKKAFDAALQYIEQNLSLIHI